MKKNNKTILARTHGSFSMRLAAIVLSIILFVVILVGLSLYQSKRQYEKQVMISNQNLSQVLDENIHHIINKTDIALLAIADEINRQIASGGINKQTLNAFIGKQKERLIVADSLRMANAEGLVSYGTAVETAPKTNIADRAHFTGPRDDPNVKLFISKPVITRIDKKWALPLSCRLSRPDGSFGGIVYANIDIKTFISMFSSLNIGSSGTIVIRDQELRIIARYPEPGGYGSTIGSKEATPEELALIRAGAQTGSFHTHSPLDQTERIYSFRKLSHYPLYVVVGRSASEYLSDWRQELINMIAILMFFIVTVLYFSQQMLFRWRGELKAREDLRKANDDLENRIVERTAEVSKVNERLQVELGERKEAEEALLVSEERLAGYNKILNGVLEHTYMMAVFLDSRFNFIWVNRAYADTCRQEPSFFTGKNHFDLYPHKENHAIFQRVVDTGEPFFVVAKPFEFPDQSERGVTYWDWSLIPVKDAAGMVTNLVFTLAEVTEQIRVKAKLIESEEKFSIAFDRAPLPMTISSIEDGACIDVNDIFVEVSGFKREDVIGKTSVELGWLKPTDRDRLIRELKEAGSVKGIELELEAKDKRKIICQYFGEIITVSGQQRLLSIALDISDRKRAEEERRILEERLGQAEKMEAIGTLAGGVAHDLNNILGALIGNAELLYYEVREGDPLREMVDEIKVSGLRAADVVQDLLTMARRGVILREPGSLNRIIANHLRSPEMRKMISSFPHVTIKTDYDRNLLDIDVSTIHIERVLTNLISNAVHAMPEKGTVTLRTDNCYLDFPIKCYHEEVMKGEYAVLTISDTGSGIHPDHLRHIFEPFYMRKMLKHGRTSLGLSVVWGAMKDHEGYIDVISEPGEGTTFILYFPVTRNKTDERWEGVSVSEYIGNGESILVVDDDDSQCHLAERMLTKLSYRVKTALSGEEAIEYLKGSVADLIVIDMIMEPGMDGYDTYRSILEIKKKQKAIIFSGFTKTERVKMAQDLGAGEFLKKPYLMETLGLAVRQELDKK